MEQLGSLYSRPCASQTSRAAPASAFRWFSSLVVASNDGDAVRAKRVLFRGSEARLDRWRIGSGFLVHARRSEACRCRRNLPRAFDVGFGSRSSALPIARGTEP